MKNVKYWNRRRKERNLYGVILLRVCDSDGVTKGMTFGKNNPIKRFSYGNAKHWYYSYDEEYNNLSLSELFEYVYPILRDILKGKRPKLKYPHFYLDHLTNPPQKEKL